MTEPHDGLTIRDYLVPGDMYCCSSGIFSHCRFSFRSYLPAVTATPRMRLNHPRVALIVTPPPPGKACAVRAATISGGVSNIPACRRCLPGGGVYHIIQKSRNVFEQPPYPRQRFEFITLGAIHPVVIVTGGLVRRMLHTWYQVPGIY